MSIAEKLSVIAENEQKVYNAGYAVSQNKPYIDTGKDVVHHSYLFQSNRWLSQIDRFDLSNIVDAAYMFMNCSQLNTAPAIDTSKATRLLYMYYNCPYLTSVEGVDFSNNPNVNMMFYNCSRLANIVINGTIPCSIDFKNSPLNLTTATNIINALVNYAGTDKEGTLSISFSSTTKAYLDEAGTIFNGLVWHEYMTSIGWTF